MAAENDTKGAKGVMQPMVVSVWDGCHVLFNIRRLTKFTECRVLFSNVPPFMHYDVSSLLTPQDRIRGLKCFLYKYRANAPANSRAVLLLKFWKVRLTYISYTALYKGANRVPFTNSI